ncbi:MAG: heparinase II/III family protein [Granulosicoccus sp.]|nr:heparinase II/III family protein [Granulosicoccus sp.]
MNMAGSFKRATQFAVTAYYLKPTQIVYRFRDLFYNKVLHRAAWYRSSFLQRATGDEPFSVLQFPYVRPAAFDSNDIEAGIFTFLNRKVNVGTPVDWTPETQSKLWIYNLHYFDYLRTIARLHQQKPSDEYYRLFRRLAIDWINHCPVSTRLAWDSYPVSLRLCNWARAYMVFEKELGADETFARQLRQSMYIQTTYLESHLEYHILNNHLLENGRALWLMGRFFAGAEPERWQKKGYKILSDGLQQNFLADGAHEEVSPMYHQIMLDMYQEIADVMSDAGEAVPAIFSTRLKMMKRWLTEVLHPDGELALFNDCAMGIAGRPSEFLDGSHEPVDGFTELPESGYYIFRNKSRDDYLILDAGPMGRDHSNGHGHCDALSFELSVAGKRLLIDSGVSDYYADIGWRDYFRSTRAHNTVVVDHQNQSDIWDRFRIAKRYRIEDVQSEGTEKFSWVAATQTGYRRIPGRVSHRRWLCHVDQQFWIICDCVEGDGTHSIESLLHFHPEVEVISPPTATQYGHAGKIRRDNTELRVLSWGTDQVIQYTGEESPELQGWYAPQFGLQFENVVWGYKQKATLPTWCGHLLWPEDSDVDLQITPLDSGVKLRVLTPEKEYQITVSPTAVELI